MKTLISLCILFLFVSCASTYTKGPDPVNAKRYNHDEKIRNGMTMKEVMDTFGSPHQVKREFVSRAMDIVPVFVYYRSIYCETVYCFVMFDKDKEVIHSVNFRAEFTDDVKY